MAMTRLLPTLSLLWLSVAAVAQQPEAVEAAAPAATAAAIAQPVEEALAAAIVREGIEKSQAMRILRDLTGKVGHRLTGSDNFTKACWWALEEFKAMGLDAHLEKWGEWKLVWNRGPWIGRVVNPIELDMYVATDAWTAGTKGLQRGRLVKAPANAEEFARLEGSLRGAFLYRTGRIPRELRAECEEAGILGWVYQARDPNAQFPTRVRVFGSHQTAMRPIEQVPTLPEIAVRKDHADKLVELLEADKPVVVEFDIQNSFREGPIELHNVIAEIKGTEKPDEVVVVCGHLDSWHQAQGCTDNGTGTCSTVEAARILAAVGARPKRTIRFMLWGGEEQGLLGSRAYVQRHRTEMPKVSAVFNHDTGTNWAWSLSVTDKMFGPMQAVLAPVHRLTPPDDDHEGPVFKLNQTDRVAGGGGSDHASFIAAGVPAWSWGLKGRSDYFQYTWHTQWDTIDVAIEEYQRHTCTVVALAALGTANLPELLDRSGVVAGGGRNRQGPAVIGAMFGAEVDGLKFVKVNEGGIAARIGIKDGDVIEQVNEIKVEQAFEIARMLRDDPAELLIVLKRGEETVRALLKGDDLEAFRRAQPTRERRGGDGAAQPGGERRGGGDGVGQPGGAGPTPPPAGGERRGGG